MYLTEIVAIKDEELYKQGSLSKFHLTITSKWVLPWLEKEVGLSIVVIPTLKVWEQEGQEFEAIPGVCIKALSQKRINS